MSVYDDQDATTWHYFDDLPTNHPGVSYTACGCVLPASCPICDGTAAEDREMRAMPAAARSALLYANWLLLHPNHAPGGRCVDAA